MVTSFWALAPEELITTLGSQDEGLSTDEAQRRSRARPARLDHIRPQHKIFDSLKGQLANPITLLLVASCCLSFTLGDRLDASILLLILGVSAGLGLWQEYGASRAMEKLLAIVRTHAQVLRDGQTVKIPVAEIVPGDIILLSAGAKIPGDCRLLEVRDLFVNEASLTGETFPVEKALATLPEATALAHRSNVVYFGTHAVSGTAKALVVHTGEQTEFSHIAARLQLRPPETEFERGIRQFGHFLMQITLLLIAGIFAANIFYDRPLLESFMFSLALAVGLTPQLLPAIISVNLAQGAKSMAEKGVIVRRLAAIENFGSMNILCSDKTGTLTEGRVVLHSSLDAFGEPSPRSSSFAALNAHLESGFSNPIDMAIRAHIPLDLKGVQKLDEIPYDFIRKRLSVLTEVQGTCYLITKGAVHTVLDVCTQVERADGRKEELSPWLAKIKSMIEGLSEKGLRTLAVAYRLVPDQQRVQKSDERELTLLGFLVFDDPIKEQIKATLDTLQSLGIKLKVISGDSPGVVQELGRKIYPKPPLLITGPELSQMSDEALIRSVGETELFAEIEPNQKERIILALKKAGHVVGYMGDGINDASALHVADVGISVEEAVDVAKEAADIVLLKRDLAVLIEGVRYGRRTFVNTLKYVYMATSANFGNMFSMAGASLFLPFLPLLPKQILLTNLLTDLPEMTIATDRVEPEQMQRPRRWNIPMIRRFMLVFGSLSSVFDFLTFAILLKLLPSDPAQFRAAWFMESVSSAALIVLVIRSPRPIWQAKPGWKLVAATTVSVGIALALPWSPLADHLGFEAPRPSLLLWLVLVLALYVLAAETCKYFFNRKT